MWVLTTSAIMLAASCSPAYKFAHGPAGADADMNLYFAPFVPSFCVSPDGRVFYFSAIYHRHRHLFRLDAVRKKVTQVTDSDHGESYPALSRDGKLLVYVKTVDAVARQAVVVRDLGTGREWVAAPAAFGDIQFPRFSQDDKRIAYARFDSQQANPTVKYLPNAVYITPSHGGRITSIFRTSSVEISPIFNTDGKQIFANYERGDPATNAIYPLIAVPTDGSANVRELTSHSTYNFSPCLVDHDQKIAYAFNNGSGAMQIFKIGKSGGNRTQLTDFGDGGSNLVSTKDGKRIFYLSQNGDRMSGINGINSDGSGRYLVADVTLFNDPMHWHGIPKYTGPVAW